MSPNDPVASTRRYRGGYRAHAHVHAQVLLGLDGTLDIELDGRAVHVDPGSGLIIPAGVVHGFASEGGARVRVVDTPPVPALDRVRAVRLPVPAVERSAAECLALVGIAPRALARRAIDPARLLLALDGRLHEPWPTARLAAVHALSASRFHARWLALTGETPQAWLRARRLDRAAAWLRDGRSLEWTAGAVGYAGASALGEALRRERGVGARVLRRTGHGAEDDRAQ